MSSKNLHLPPRFQKSSLFFKILSIIILIMGMGHFYIYTDLLKQWNDFLYRGFSAFYYVKLLANIILALLLFLVIKKEKQRNLEA